MTEINESIVVEAPYSIVLDALERRLAAVHNRIRLTVPFKSLGLPAPFGLEAEVDVSFVSLRGEKGRAQLHDEMQLHWEAVSGPYPRFDGAFTMQPVALQTELRLAGGYDPPMGFVGDAFDAVIGAKIARATARALLEDLKGLLEADFATVRNTIEQTPPQH